MARAAAGSAGQGQETGEVRPPGNPGDVRALGGGVTEMRVDFGPGYCVYFRQLGDSYVMLCGGDKNSQARDIAKAKALASELGG